MIRISKVYMSKAGVVGYDCQIILCGSVFYTMVFCLFCRDKLTNLLLAYKVCMCLHTLHALDVRLKV